MFQDNAGDTDSERGICFISKMEQDLQRVFDYIHDAFHTQTNLCVKNSLKKGSMFLKGDFILNLGNVVDRFSNDTKSALLNNLREIPYIRECEIDDNDNLILCLNRTALFRSILKDVMNCGQKYGIRTTNRSYHIFIHNEVFKNFDSVRLALIADCLVSFLTAHGAKVSVNESRKDVELSYKPVPTYACTEECLEKIASISELIKSSAKKDKLTLITETGNTMVDFKKYLETFKLWDWYGKDTSNLVIHKDLPNLVINQSSYTMHFLQHHLTQLPDVIIHVCSDSQKRKITDSGLLLNMLKLVDVPQYFISCQTTFFKPEVTIDTFMNFQKAGIENAMTQKFDSDQLTTEMWNKYLRNLVDTAVKFYFFKAGSNVPLKLNLTLDKDGIFVQYNFARLSNLLNMFELKVEEGYYEPLPEIDEINFAHLRFEEEWNLLNFVLSFPRLIEEVFSPAFPRSFENSKICNMLKELCRCFSKYYSRIHILGGPQVQLQNVMHARLWLLKGIHQVMCNSFALLNIEGLNKM